MVNVMVVPELAKEERKTSYVNFKCVIWHEAFFKLLKKLCDDPHEAQKANALAHFAWSLQTNSGTYSRHILYEMHTIQQHKEALVIYEDKKSAGKKKLKSLGLFPFKNIFWSVAHSEPEQAASFEPLHSLHGGLGGKHTHEELKIVSFHLSPLMQDMSRFSGWVPAAMHDLQLPATRHPHWARHTD
ncbi:hypothetical protein F5141DRAFT_1068568 [Pisolithus sp. B1]|nr:hypothetical protein F5141DRAFT_1068568 [Pisolithus sp. B1]